VMWIPTLGALAPATVAPLIYTLAAAAMGIGIAVAAD